MYKFVPFSYRCFTLLSDLPPANLKLAFVHLKTKNPASTTQSNWKINPRELENLSLFINSDDSEKLAKTKIGKLSESRLLSECISSQWIESHDLFSQVWLRVHIYYKKNSNQEIPLKIPCRTIEKSHEKIISQQALCGWKRNLKFMKCVCGFLWFFKFL